MRAAMNAILAPVPAVHMPDALEIVRSGGVVAFGSNSFETLDRLRKRGAVGTTAIYIVVSKTGFDPTNPRHEDLKVGKVQVWGTRSAIVDAVNGRHSDETKRPATALEETPCGMFQEGRDLVVLKPALTIGQFSMAAGKAWKTTPEGPVEAHLGHSEL